MTKARRIAVNRRSHHANQAELHHTRVGGGRCRGRHRRRAVAGADVPAQPASIAVAPIAATHQVVPAANGGGRLHGGGWGGGGQGGGWGSGPGWRGFGGWDGVHGWGGGCSAEASAASAVGTAFTASAELSSLSCWCMEAATMAPCGSRLSNA